MMPILAKGDDVRSGLITAGYRQHASQWVNEFEKESHKIYANLDEMSMQCHGQDFLCLNLIYY